MRIGPYDLAAIETGEFGLDGGAMFGVVPKPLWEKLHPPDERNRITMASRALLLRDGTRTILVDTGNGTKLPPKLAGIYRIDTRTDVLAASLAAHGVAPESVTDVILTHLHFDHAGGATRRVDGELLPAFPRARYHLQRDHWQAALHPTERDRASFLPDDFVPLRERGLLEFTDGEGELFPGIRLRLLHGHTTALQAPLISDGTTTLFFCADLFPLTAHLHLPWIMGYDLRPLATLEEKRRILAEALEQQWILFFEHDPSVVAARLSAGEKGAVLGPMVSLV
jgi:glyoxylase-like metal-dependent hydrolase (beta-lactamase superfamily II)